MSLTIRELTVRFGTTEAVSDVDLSVAGGEVVALLGPSGCGKSTLLRAVAGLERPTSGGIHWNGDDLARVPVHRRGFGMVFQDGQLFPHRDVAGNVEFGMRMRAHGRAHRKRKVGELLDVVGLDGYQRRRVTELSGGEAQRVALARALAADSRLLLLDEPLSALDRVLRDQLAVDLAALLDRDDATAIVVTHDHDEAFTLADRVAVLLDGTISQVDTPSRLWRHPATDQVAEFLGCTTLLPARVSDGIADCALGRVAIGAADGAARLGLRASGVHAVPAGATESTGAESTGAESTGAESTGAESTGAESTGAESAGADGMDGGAAGTVLDRVHRHDHVRLGVDVPEVGKVEAIAQINNAPGTGERVRLELNPDGVALVGE